MTPIYIKKLKLKIWKTNIRVQKIDSLLSKTYKIVIAAF